MLRDKNKADGMQKGFKGWLTDMDKKTLEIIMVLQSLKIKFKIYTHEQVFNMEQSTKLELPLRSLRCKNLFLQNKNKTKYFLVIIGHEKRADLKSLQIQLQTSSLSFTSEERLFQMLGLTSGAVSPFGLIYDKEKKVNVVIDDMLLNEQYLSFHPNINTATLELSMCDFKKYLEWCKNQVLYIQI